MIFVSGIQRSGTNFAHTIIENSVQACYPYFKHDPKLQDIDPECVKVFCIIKNPYTWVESICFRNEVDIVKWYPGLNLRDHEDYLGPFHINLKRLLIAYRLFYTSWLNYEKTKLIHYEDLLKKTNNTNFKTDHNDNWDANRKKSYIHYQTTLLPNESKDIITNFLGQEFFKLIKYPIQ